MPSNHLIICRPLLSLPSIFPSVRVFSNQSALRIRWPKYWRFSFNISPSNEHTGLISLRMDWLDLLAVQGTLKSLLQHHSSKTSILQHSAFFIVQLSHPYMTTVKPIALTRWTFVDKVMSLLFNMLARLFITFLPRSKCLLISNSMVAVTICSAFEGPKNKVSHCFHCFPIYFPLFRTFKLIYFQSIKKEVDELMKHEPTKNQLNTYRNTDLFQALNKTFACVISIILGGSGVKEYAHQCLPMQETLV